MHVSVCADTSCRSHKYVQLLLTTFKKVPSVLKHLVTKGHQIALLNLPVWLVCTRLQKAAFPGTGVFTSNWFSQFDFKNVCLPQTNGIFLEATEWSQKIPAIYAVLYSCTCLKFIEYLTAIGRIVFPSNWNAGVLACGISEGADLREKAKGCWKLLRMKQGGPLIRYDWALQTKTCTGRQNPAQWKGCHRAAASSQPEGRRHLPRGPQKHQALPTHWTHASSVQHCEPTRFFCRNHAGCDSWFHFP